MFGFLHHGKKKRRAKPAKKPQAMPAQQARPQAGPEIRDVYLMIRKAKNMLDMIPDVELVYAKRAMNTLEDILWQSVNH